MKINPFDIFEDKVVLILLALIPLMIAAYCFFRKRRQPWFVLPSADFFGLSANTLKIRLHWIPFALRMMALTLIIIALARPVSESRREDITTEGIDIVFAIDISSSMLARDFKPDRLEAVKEVAKEFVDARPNDRFGIVAFSGESFTACPLTVDYILVKQQIEMLKTGLVEDGTAIGDGLATAINRLRESTSSSKVIILLTDGENNRGFVDPNTAAEMAKVLGIRVYTIGAGTNGRAYQPVALAPNGSFIYDYADVKIDEALLKRIASVTNAKMFRATDKQALRNTYNEIDQLEKTKMDVSVFKRKHDEFSVFLWLALVLIFAEFLLRTQIFKSLP